MSILILPPVAVNLDFADANEAEEFRPTAGPNFIPTAAEEAEAAEILNDEGEPSDAYWDARADEAHALDLACSGYWCL